MYSQVISNQSTVAAAAVAAAQAKKNAASPKPAKQRRSVCNVCGKPAPAFAQCVRTGSAPKPLPEKSERTRAKSNVFRRYGCPTLAKQGWVLSCIRTHLPPPSAALILGSDSPIY